MNNKNITVYLLVDNEFGVLSRITGLLRQQGYNIKCLAVETTEKPEISQMLISVEYNAATLQLVISRLNKLNCVKKTVQIKDDLDFDSRLHNVFSKIHEALEGGF